MLEVSQGERQPGVSPPCLFLGGTGANNGGGQMPGFEAVIMPIELLVLLVLMILAACFVLWVARFNIIQRTERVTTISEKRTPILKGKGPPTDITPRSIPAFWRAEKNNRARSQYGTKVYKSVA